MSTETLIAAIDVKIAALVENPEVSYKIGDKSVSASDKLKQLIELRKILVANPDADLSLVAFDYDISEFGSDDSQEVE